MNHASDEASSIERVVASELHRRHGAKVISTRKLRPDVGVVGEERRSNPEDNLREGWCGFSSVELLGRVTDYFR